MKTRVNSMTAGLAIGTIAAVAIACGLGAYLYSIHHFDSLMQSARETSLAESEMIRVALEHQMMENDRSLIGEMIRSFGKEPRISAVVLLDRTGHAQYSSVPLPEGNDLTIGSPTCQSCHQYPPEQRTSSRVIETRGGEVLRTVIPFRNREQCHACHSPDHKINGILIVDTNAAEIRAGMNRDLRWMAAGSGALMLVLVTALGTVFRLVVMRRLQRFETTARLIAAGDLERRVPAGGSDIVSWLAREFNTMADSTTGLLHQVREQRERLETVINSIDDGIVVLDTERRVIAANDSFLRRTGLTRDDVLGCSCQNLTPGLCEFADCPTHACIGSGERQVRVCERRTASGQLAWEEVHSSPILGPLGQVQQVVEVWRDITRRRADEAKMSESHRLASLGLLASGFSHELNTPLATALVCVEGILRTGPAGNMGEAEGRLVLENARIAREQLIRCGGITQHFLRLSSGKAAPMDIVDVGVTIAAVARLLSPTARAHEVTVDVAPVPPGTLVRADDAELQHVLLNLLVNAIQASQPGSRVRLGLEPGKEEAPSVRIFVEDEGCGIAPEDQARIFEPFVGMRQGGTGLGLFLSLNFVRQWAGEITVDSAPGRGSRFTVTLPSLENPGPLPGGTR
jgi:PAS domain S-box-containing protein